MMIRQGLLAVMMCVVVAGCIPGKPATQAAVAAPKGDVLEVGLLNGQAKLLMTRIQSDKYGSIWSTPDGVQVFLRGGMLVGTRGVIADLMSADAPSVQTLVRGGGEHKRTYYYLDGTDTTYAKQYTCVVTPAESGAAQGAAYALEESCTSERGQFRNKFWISRDLTVVKSRQWIGSGVGYADIVQQSARN